MLRLIKGENVFNVGFYVIIGGHLKQQMLHLTCLKTLGWTTASWEAFAISRSFKILVSVMTTKIKGSDKGNMGASGTGIYCHPVVWLMTFPVEWCYVTSAVSCLNGRAINQPAQPQQHSKFSPSCCECSSSPLPLGPPLFYSFLNVIWGR